VLPQLRFVLGATHVVLSLHAFAIVAGVVGGTLLALRRARDPASALAAVAAVTVAALLGAHGLFLLLRGERGGVWTGGLASLGGVVAGLAAAALVSRIVRRPAGEVLDAIAPAGLLALGIGRLGCFLAGCCYGRETALPWGVVFPALGPPPRHPLQLYSAAADIGLVLLLPRRAALTGVVACRACLGFGIVRAVLEWLRDPACTDALVRGVVTLPQAAALLIAGGALWVERRLRHAGPSTMPPARRKLAHGR
jgi:phosphatidylglycerol:prolipoprotein diacylglycerol transferase